MSLADPCRAAAVCAVPWCDVPLQCAVAAARWLLRAVWFAVPILLASCWAFLLLARSSYAPYGTTGDATSIVIATLAALLPWTLAGIVMC